MQKWEYCLLKQLSGQKYWIYTEAGKLIKYQGEKYTFQRIIMRLGYEGWEAVNYLMSDFPKGLTAAWPESQSREILFKRPAQFIDTSEKVTSKSASDDVADWISEILVDSGRQVQGD
jgi:hypothetical protein